jgi:hypothetical protein
VALNLGPCNPAAIIAAEYFDVRLEAYCRKFADQKHDAVAVFAIGRLVVICLANRGYHIAC